MDDEQAKLHRAVQYLIDQLADEFKDRYDRETIAGIADESMRQLQGASVKEFVPIFVYRFTRDRLLEEASPPV